ncbi:hypothetical protein [Sorangium sp. So ce388]|uniref:hypothetical protein n=1 Tax=Sorangium sp. So ce388 TaxID=3133309 RepID=UPI003F5BA1A0
MNPVALTTGAGQIVAGAVLGYLTVSMAESFLHRNALHARLQVRRAAQRLGPAGRPLLRAYLSHAVVHHGKTYRESHVRQFQSQEEQERLDRWIVETQGDRRIIRERYGVSLAGLGILAFVAPVLPFFALYAFFLPAAAFVGALLPLAIYPLSSLVLHPYLHLPRAEAMARASRPTRWLIETRYVRFISRHHYLHHRYVHCNYNLLWLGDLLLGRHRLPSDQDLAEMRGQGMIC